LPEIKRTSLEELCLQVRSFFDHIIYHAWTIPEYFIYSLRFNCFPKLCYELIYNALFQ
jgi:hypothetical protein